MSAHYSTRHPSGCGCVIGLALIAGVAGYVVWQLVYWIVNQKSRSCLPRLTDRAIIPRAKEAA